MWRVRLGCALLVALLLATASCRRETPPSPAAEGATAVESATPEGLLFRGILPGPQLLWEAVRGGVAESGRALPKHYPLVLTELLGASPLLTGRFELDAPVRLALALEADQLHWIAAFRVVSGAELVAELTTGARAPYRAEPHPGYVALARPGTVEYPAPGVSSGHFLLGSSARALEVLGSFVAAEQSFTELQAPAGTLRLRSEAGAGARLARSFDAWWSGRGAEWRQALATGALPEWGEPLQAALGTSLESLARGLSALLASVERADLSLSVRGGEVALSSEHVGAAPGQPLAGACEVLSSCPLPSPLLAVAWAAPEALRVALPPSAGSSSPAPEFAFTGPTLFGVADVEGQAVGFLDAGRPDAAALDAAAFGVALTEWTRKLSPNLRVWRPKDAARARWLLASEGTQGLEAWLESARGAGAAFPWKTHCESLLFAAMVGEGKQRVQAWAWRHGEGFSLKASVPLAGMLPPAR